MLTKTALWWLRIASASSMLCLCGGCPLESVVDDDPASGDDDTGEEEPLAGQVHGPLDVDFGYVEAGTAAEVDLEIRNSGMYWLEITAVTITGCEPGIFEVDHTAPVLVAPETFEIYAPMTVRFTPPAGGLEEADLEIYSSDPHYEDGEPHVIPLRGTGTVDADGDGYFDGTSYPEPDADCDDGDPAICPDPVYCPEICNGIDDDCSGGPAPDEVDNDNDGYRVCDGDCDDGDPGQHLDDEDFDGVSPCDGDCDDHDTAVHAGLAEVPDGKDNDCDGVVDEDTAAYDDDGDGACEGFDLHGNGPECSDGAVPGDCDDADAGANLLDLDGDGVDTCAMPPDCDDADPVRFPGNPEICDTRDNDCDGSPDPSEVDLDADGYMACEGDCDDGDPQLHPGDLDLDGASPCDGDCDDADPALNLDDADLDGFSTCTGDCDPGDGAVHPGAPEQCNGLDDDCDGAPLADEVDGDGDGVRICAGDCDDDEPLAHPGLTETCGDGIDNDCDGGANGCLPEGEIDLAEADAKLLGAAWHDGAGVAVSAAGDVDGDGFDDILVGSWTSHLGGNESGAVSLMKGPITAEISLATADATYYYNVAMSHVGRSLSRPVRFPNDPIPKLLIGSYFASIEGDYNGAAFLADSSGTGTIDLAGCTARFLGDDWSLSGTPVALAGDTNGDGVEEFLVGTQTSHSYLFESPQQGDIGPSDAIAHFQGENSSDSAGFALDGIGDIDADGNDDLLIGAFGESTNGDSAGAAYILYGPVVGDIDLATADAKLLGPHEDAWAGFYVSRAGDVDADGDPDFLVGVFYDDTAGEKAGAAFLVYSPVSGVHDLQDIGISILGEAADDWASVVAAAGDVDGDGYDDILVGASGQDAGGADAGAAYLLYGPVLTDLSLASADAKFVGEAAGNGAAIVAGAGDVDGDGYDDILIGAPGEDTAGENAGAVYLILGGAL